MASDVRDRKPTVLIVGQGSPAKGGIPSFVSDLLLDRWLRERVRLEYFNTTPDGVRRPGSASLANVVLTMRHASRVFARARKVDVVHLNVAPAPALPLARAMVLCVAARLAGARTILHAHTGRLDMCSRSPVYRLLLRAALAISHTFVVVSVPAERAVARLGRSGKVVRLQNWVDPDTFGTGPKPTQPPVLTFVGTVCERKGLLDLCRALVDLRRRRGFQRGDLRVIIVGDSSQEGPGVDARIRRTFEHAGLGWVEFVGVLERPEVLRILAESSILCLPSHWEGFPLSVLEGMASGAAIIATRVGDIPWMIEGAGILLDPGDVGALSRAIERLVVDQVERDRLGRRGRSRVEEDLSRSRLVPCVYSLYLGASGLSQAAAIPSDPVERSDVADGAHHSI